MRNRLSFTCLLALAVVDPMAGSRALAQTDPAQAQGGVQDPRSTRSDERPGESLSERLNRTDGVIRPPANIVPQMPQVHPPATDPGTTPVIPPPGTPGGNQQVEQK
jgi:hypothetical protein